MSLDEADFRKVFWMQGNFCVHYQWEIILSSIVLCILSIRYSSSAADSADVFAATRQPVSCSSSYLLGILYFRCSHHRTLVRSSHSWWEVWRSCKYAGGYLDYGPRENPLWFFGPFSYFFWWCWAFSVLPHFSSPTELHLSSCKLAS